MVGRFCLVISVTLLVNGKPAGGGRMDHTVPFHFNGYSGMVMGRDNGLVVDQSYVDKAPFAFTGTVKRGRYLGVKIPPTSIQDFHLQAARDFAGKLANRLMDSSQASSLVARPPVRSTRDISSASPLLSHGSHDVSTAIRSGAPGR